MDRLEQQLANIDKLKEQIDKILLSTDEEGNYLRGHECLRVLLFEVLQRARDVQTVIDGLRARRQIRIGEETTTMRREREAASDRESLNQSSKEVGAARARDRIRPNFNAFEMHLDHKLSNILDECDPNDASVALTCSLFSYIYCRWGNWPMTIEHCLECLQDHADRPGIIPNFRWKVSQAPDHA